MKTTRQPTTDQLAYLNKLLDRDHRKLIRQRIKILLLALRGLTCRKIAEKIFCDKNTVSNVLRIWNTNNITGIITYRTTDSWKRQVKRRQAVEKLVSIHPHRLHLSFNSWSLKKLSKFFSDLVGYNISTSTISKDLKILGITYKKIQDTFIFKPVDYEIKRAWLTYLIRYCPPSWRLIYIDEKGPIYAMRYSGHTWSFNQQFRDIRQPIKAKVNFLGGYDPKSKKLEMIPMEGNASTYFCDALDLIKLEFLTRDYNKLLLIMDNARIHTSAETTTYLNDDPQLEYYNLPAYSPELNPIEKCFQHYKKEILENGSFTSKQDVIDATTNYCNYFQTLRPEIYA